MRPGSPPIGDDGLAGLLAAVEAGERLPTDPWLTVVPQPPGRAAAVVAFPGRVVVAADVSPQWVYARLPEVDLGAPLNPPFLAALCARLRRRINNIDMVLLAGNCGDRGTDRAPCADGKPDIDLAQIEDADHPRVRRARRYRNDVRIWTTRAGETAGLGIVIIGRGLAGRWEVAIEVAEGGRNAGLGRRLAAAARCLVPDGRPLWAQAAPGNAASVRALLAAGYRPVGAEALLMAGGGPAPRGAS